jgi:WD40 repeat protein
LQKNPHNRYESAKELMDDIDRFLTGAIVQAYEYSAVELARRVYQRNKAPIHTALAASILLAATGVFAAVNIVRSRNAAVAARDNEAAARQQAEATNYTNQVRLAHSYLQDHNNERAKELLWETGPELRQWEWGYLLNKAYQDLYTITGNHGFAISHDAEHLACFYRHQPVTIYDAQNGSQIRSLTPPSGDWVRQTQFNSDDSRLLIQTANGPVQIWETDNWEFLGDIRPPGAGALDASFLPDGRLLTSGDDGTVRVWNQDLQEQQPPMLADAPQIGKISCSTDGLRAAAIIGEEDQRSIQVWEIASRQSIGTVKLDEDASYVQVNSLAKQAASVSGKIVKLWDLETSEFVHRWDAFPDGVSGLAYNSTGDSLAVTGHDRILTVWNTQTRQQLLRTRSSIDVAKPRWSPDGELICTLPLPYDGYPQVWNSSNLQLVTDIGVHKLPILFYGFFPDSDRLLTSSGDRTMKVWNAQSASGQQVIKQMDQRIIDLVVSADGNRFATVDFQRAVSVVDLAQEKLLAQFVSHRDEPKTAISPDGSKVLTSLDTVTLAVLDVDTNALHSTFDEHNSMVNCVAISPNGEHFASASWDGSVYVWNPNTADALAKIQHGRVPTTLMFGSSGDRLVIGDNQGNITIYNWASGEAIQQSTEHSSEVVALQWSEDRKYLASAEKKGPLVLWSFSDDEISKRLILRGHNSEPSSIAFLGESDRLASCADNGVRIWDLTTGEQVLTLDDATEASSVIAAVPGSDGLLSAQGRMVRLWSPAPWKQISAAADMQAEFQEHRRTRLDQDAESLPAGGFDSRLVIMPSARLNESLSDLKDEISSQSDAITFAADDPKGLRIVAASDQSWLELGVAVGDLIQAIDGSETSTVPLAEAAIETLMQADGKNAFSVKMLRAGQPKQIIIQRRPTTTDTITISQSRSEAINRYKRFAESLRSLRRLQTETSPANVSKAGGIVLAGTFPEQDRELLIQSGIAPEDVVVRFIDEPVTDVKQLIADVEGLVEKLQSEQVSEFEVEVRRGQFRRVRINNVVN